MFDKQKSLFKIYIKKGFGKKSIKNYLQFSKSVSPILALSNQNPAIILFDFFFLLWIYISNTTLTFTIQNCIIFLRDAFNSAMYPRSP